LRGRVERYLGERRAEGVLHFSLVDPHKVDDLSKLELTAEELKGLGTDAFLVGGSLGVSPFKMLEVVKVLKKTGLPVIIFPGDVSNVVPEADAILFMSLLNSEDPYFITGAQLQGAHLVLAYGLEALPTAYVIVGHGGAAGFIGKARPVPWEHPELAASYVLVAKLLGMRFAYLEAGSGSPRPVPPEAVELSKRLARDVFLIVGGGVRDESTAAALARSGADAIVTGTLIEKDGPRAVGKVIKAVKSSSKSP